MPALSLLGAQHLLIESCARGFLRLRDKLVALEATQGLRVLLNLACAQPAARSSKTKTNTDNEDVWNNKVRMGALG